MENDNEIEVMASTSVRSLEPIQKLGFSDGVVDGQAKNFQSSFDQGYEAGLNFGLKLGYQNAMSSTSDVELKDAAKINCQICLKNVTLEDSIEIIHEKQINQNNYLKNNWDKNNK